MGQVNYKQLDTSSPTNPSIIINSCLVHLQSDRQSQSFRSDNVGVEAYYLSESSSAPSAQSQGWVEILESTSYTADVDYTLADDTGGSTERTIYTWFKDAQGNLSQGAFDSIAIDLQKPLLTTVLINNNSSSTLFQEVTVKIVGYDDNYIDGFCIKNEISESPKNDDACWQTINASKNINFDVDYLISLH